MSYRVSSKLEWFPPLVGLHSGVRAKNTIKNWGMADGVMAKQATSTANALLRPSPMIGYIGQRI